MGIETEKFVAPVDDDFVCIICTFVLDNPVRISGCEHMYCRECINEWIQTNATCPVDRKTIDKSRLIAPDRTVINMLNKLKLKCNFESLGCEQVVQLEAWKSHTNQCDFNPDNKQPCVGCGKMMLKKDATSHKCLEKYEFENMKLKQENNEMKYLVSDHQLRNEMLEEEIQKLNRKINDRNDLIRELVDKNDDNNQKKQIKDLENETKSMSQSTEITFIKFLVGIFNYYYFSPPSFPALPELNSLESKTTTSTLDKWNILSRLPFRLKKRIRLASVFGDGQKFQSIFITENDEAFWLEADALAMRRWELYPEKIDQLSNIRVKSLIFSGDYLKNNGRQQQLKSCVLALTGKSSDSVGNQVMVWSDSPGHSLTGERPLTTKRFTWCSNLISKWDIDQVAAGDRHALALNKNNEVWAWGMNNDGQLGTGTTDNQDEPVKVTVGTWYQQCVAVACCSNSSFALTKDGEVWSWGGNDWGQLGIEKQENVMIIRPTLIEALAIYKIRRLACGRGHVLAVDENGSLFAWGNNDNGQLGTGDKINRSKPVKVGNSESVKFIEVAACNSGNNLSVALSDDDRCWIWGKCRTEKDGLKDEVVPKLVNGESVASLYDALAEYGQDQLSGKTMLIRS